MASCVRFGLKIYTESRLRTSDTQRKSQLVAALKQVNKAAQDSENAKRSSSSNAEEAIAAAKLAMLMAMMAAAEAEKLREGVALMQELLSSFVQEAKKTGRVLRVPATTKNGTMDIFYDGFGYLTALRATDQTIQQAARLTADCKIYVIAYLATDEVIELARRTRDVQLFRLSDMTIAKQGWGSGAPPKCDFEKYLERNGKAFKRA